jgi:hypothetical protein
MTKNKDPRGALRLVLLVALVTMMLAAAATALGQADPRGQQKGTWQDLVLLYTTDVKGKIDPCG